MQAQAIDVAGRDGTPSPQPEQPAGWLNAIKRKSKLIVLGVAVLAVAGAGSVGAVKYLGQDKAAAPAEGAGPENFVDVPPMVVNLRSADGQARYLKLRFMAVASSADKADQIRARMPLILDSFQPFLRELRPEDLNGSAAVFRVKEEMLRRASDVVGAGLVKDILIQDLVQQ
ncbi:MAG TPA: flagellar basal body-associated FliL family protein [Sphingobium sp.]|uniref:flagellar basal body-associated FliL family protein n=1 Tax=Sphingobium sp. TaxID=1912891 RepID=UPI002ED6094C